VEVNISITANGKAMLASSGSETMAFFPQREYAGQLKREKGKNGAGSRMV